MRIVIVGQQAFGKSVLEAFLARGDQIVGVFAAPERPGSRPDPLVQAAEEKSCRCSVSRSIRIRRRSRR